MEKIVPLSVPNLKGNELDYVSDAVRQEWVSTGGGYIKRFEQSVQSYVGTEDAVALQSGTAGLHLSLEMCGVERGDEVIVPTLTFIAAVNPVRYLGAEPVFMDCDDSLCIDPDKLEQFCATECSLQGDKLINKTTGKHIKALIIVHVFGNLAEMERLLDMARTYHLKVVEDATEAIGSYFKQGKYQGKHAGTLADFGVYSFNGNKIITTGGGGMVVSRHPEQLRKLRYLSTQAKDDELYYIHDNVGYNYRMTNLQGALGLAQMEQLEDFIKIKKQNYDQYKVAIENIAGLTLLPFRSDIRANHWFYSLVIGEDYPKSRDQLLRHLSEKGVQTRPIWGLIHEQKPYRNNQAYQIDKAKEYYKKVLNLPCSTNLTFDQIDQVIDCL